MGMAYLLEKTPLSREQRDYTDWLNSSLKRLYSIISDILDVSKIYSRQMTLERKLFSFEGAVKEVMESFRDVAKKKNISFRVTVDDSVPPYLYGDPYRFRQVITQLLDNAFKFTHHGQVIFKADTVNRKDPLVLVRIRVLDTGIGIPGETRQKIGEFFYQADSSTTKKYPGLGSGLFLANQLILKMNGYLRIRSNPARGSCFRVEIPFEYSGDLENSSEIAVS
jgi:signal transduction histidine kinase